MLCEGEFNCDPLEFLHHRQTLDGNFNMQAWYYDIVIVPNNERKSSRARPVVFPTPALVKQETSYPVVSSSSFHSREEHELGLPLYELVSFPSSYGQTFSGRTIDVTLPHHHLNQCHYISMGQMILFR